MTRLRTAVLAALLWCGVVAVVATLVWVVISRAGQGVVPVTQPQADVTGSLPVPGSEHSALRTSPGVTLSPRPSRSPSPSRGATPASPPSSSPSSPLSSPLSSPSSSGSSAPSAPSTAAGPAVQRRSWSGAAGHVVAECRGRAAELVSAFPDPGWRYVIGSRGPAQVRVRFVRTSGDDTSVSVAARCVAGVPHFWLPSDDGGGGD